MDGMLLGAIATASMVIALFFLRFWRASGDRFFLFFALSFALEGIHRLLFSVAAPVDGERPLYYLIRLIAYALIVFAILDKNRPRSKD